MDLTGFKYLLGLLIKNSEQLYCLIIYLILVQVTKAIPMQASLPLETNQYYHIYNRGINSCDLFSEDNNYTYFFNLIDKYIDPIADIFAWALMPNHFHLLVRLKNNITYKYFSTDRSIDAVWFNDRKLKTTNLLASEGSDSVKIITIPAQTDLISIN